MLNIWGQCELQEELLHCARGHGGDGQGRGEGLPQGAQHQPARQGEEDLQAPEDLRRARLSRLHHENLQRLSVL